jgi:tRNA dimethylallyltransferase
VVAKTTKSFLIAIVGETASGKSSLALELAECYNGEIIAADSRTVYKGMDIGTAKPSREDQARVPHHLLDISTPDMPISAAIFQQRAHKIIDDIAGRGKTPFLVGGTGLYIDAILYDFTFHGQADTRERQALQQLSVDELQQRLHDENIPLPQNYKNPRHLIRQLETRGMHGERHTLRPNTMVFGLTVDPEKRKVRIAERVADMMQQGLKEEARRLFNTYGEQCPALQTIGYQEFVPYFHDIGTLEEVQQRIVRHTLAYARRQRTWFRRNKDIHWICKKEEVDVLITTELNK